MYGFGGTCAGIAFDFPLFDFAFSFANAYYQSNESLSRTYCFFSVVMISVIFTSARDSRLSSLG